MRGIGDHFSPPTDTPPHPCNDQQVKCAKRYRVSSPCKTTWLNNVQVTCWLKRIAIALYLLFPFFSLPLSFVGQIMFSHHSEQMSQKSQVSTGICKGGQRGGQLCDGHGGWEGGQHHGEQISNWWKWENSQKSERVKKRSESSKKVKIVKTVKIVKKMWK